MVANTETRRSLTLSQIREWLTLICAIVVVFGGLLGGMRLVIAPRYTEIQAVSGRLDRMDERLDRMETEIRDGREELKAVREDIAALSERLTRVEILLEQRGEVAPQKPPG